jgi:hypothetical protein
VVLISEQELVDSTHKQVISQHLNNNKNTFSLMEIVWATRYITNLEAILRLSSLLNKYLALFSFNKEKVLWELSTLLVEVACMELLLRAWWVQRVVQLHLSWTRISIIELVIRPTSNSSSLIKDSSHKYKDHHSYQEHFRLEVTITSIINKNNNKLIHLITQYHHYFTVD